MNQAPFASSMTVRMRSASPPKPVWWRKPHARSSTFQFQEFRFRIARNCRALAVVTRAAAC